MNQDQVKEKLLKLHDCSEDFKVIFTGKKSKKVNGLYKVENKEIIIYNRNFHNDGGINENLLFYTAMHELAHHIQFTEQGQKSSKAHTQFFYAILDDLADTAEKKKLYHTGIDDDTEKLIDKVRDISCKIAELQRKLGGILVQLNEVCEKKGIRYEDVIERKAQISLQTMKKAIKACDLGLSDDIGLDIQEAVIRERDEDRQKSIINAAQKGKSVAQVKRSAAVPPEAEDETVSLIKEKARLEKTIESLKRRLEEVAEQLNSRGEL
jgi:hypothetical protein